MVPVSRILPELPELPGLPPGVRRGVERSVRALAAAIWDAPVPCLSCPAPARRLFTANMTSQCAPPRAPGYVIVRSLRGVVVGRYDPETDWHHLVGAVPACESCLENMRRWEEIHETELLDQLVLLYLRHGGFDLAKAPASA